MLTNAKKLTMIKIHILLLRDTASAMDLVSPQQSAALGSGKVSVTVVSTGNLHFKYLVLRLQPKRLVKN